MKGQSITLTGIERTFDKNDIIVSKTNPRGIITYVNTTFVEVSGFGVSDVLGKPHNIVRHPQMPRAVFKFMWDRIEAGHEIFAYVINRAKNGDHYWVFAHVTPSYDTEGTLVGYHSNRRVANPAAIKSIHPVYRHLREIEARHPDPKAGLAASSQALADFLSQKGVAYDAFILSI